MIDITTLGNDNEELCENCDIVAKTEINMNHLFIKKRIRLCESCEYQMYTRLHEHRQRKLSQHLSAIIMHQSS